MAGIAPIGREQKTVSTAAVGFASIPTGATSAVVRCSGANVRWGGSATGTVPTAALGVPLKVDETLEIDGHDLSTYRFIRSGAADATLDVAYF